MIDFTLKIEEIEEANDINYFIVIDSFNTVLGRADTIEEAYIILQLFSESFDKIYKQGKSYEIELKELERILKNPHEIKSEDFVINTLIKSLSFMLQPRENSKNLKNRPEFFEIKFNKKFNDKSVIFQPEEIKSTYGLNIAALNDNENISFENSKKINELAKKFQMDYLVESKSSSKTATKKL